MNALDVIYYFVKKAVQLSVLFTFLLACSGDLLMKQASCPSGYIRVKNQCVEDHKKFHIGDNCEDPDLSLVAETESITRCDGSVAKGSLKVCDQDGLNDCVLEKNFRAVDKSKIDYQGILSTTTVLGQQGKLVLSPWDVRNTVKVGSVTGKLLVACRNGVDLSRFDQAEYPKSATVDQTTDTITVANHGWSENQIVSFYYNTVPTGINQNTLYYLVSVTANTFQISLTASGSAVAISANGSNVFVYRRNDGVAHHWDTIDDHAGLNTSIPSYSEWSVDSNICGGVEQTENDSNVWKDVTTTGDGKTSSTCTAHPSNCSFRDKISGLEWHKSDLVNRDYNQSLAFCEALIYNGFSDWRLPTNKEFLGAYAHGFISLADRAGWMSLSTIQEDFWTNTTTVLYEQESFHIEASSGYNIFNPKQDFITLHSICVRP